MLSDANQFFAECDNQSNGSPSRKKVITAAELIDAACAYSNITIQEFKSERRIAEYVRPRWAVTYVLKHCRPDLSYTQIARHLGRKGGHSNVSHAVTEATRLRATCASFAAMILHLEGIANGA